jgi:hypothetical protein
MGRRLAGAVTGKLVDRLAVIALARDIFEWLRYRAVRLQAEG